MKDVKFEFNEECLHTFQVLKEKTITRISLYLLSIYHTSDTSGTPIGTILAKKINNVIQSIYYTSRPLTKTQLNYTTTKKELLADVLAFDKFRLYLIRSKVLVYTSHMLWSIFWQKKMQIQGCFDGFSYKNLIWESKTRSRKLGGGPFFGARDNNWRRDSN